MQLVGVEAELADFTRAWHQKNDVRLKTQNPPIDVPQQSVAASFVGGCVEHDVERSGEVAADHVREVFDPASLGVLRSEAQRVASEQPRSRSGIVDQSSNGRASFPDPLDDKGFFVPLVPPVGKEACRVCSVRDVAASNPVAGPSREQPAPAATGSGDWIASVSEALLTAEISRMGGDGESSVRRQVEENRHSTHDRCRVQSRND